MNMVRVLCGFIPPLSNHNVANLDAEDESLARWKASLGIGASSASSGGPQVTCYMSALRIPPNSSTGRRQISFLEIFYAHSR